MFHLNMLRVHETRYSPSLFSSSRQYCPSKPTSIRRRPSSDAGGAPISRRTRSRCLTVRCAVEVAPTAAAATVGDSVAKLTKDAVTKVKAVVTVKVLNVRSILADLGIKGAAVDELGGFIDDLEGIIVDINKELFGKALRLELVSSEPDPRTGKEKETVVSYDHKASHQDGEIKYECEFSVPSTFGDIGAVLVENEHHKEMYLQDIKLMIAGEDTITVDCRSWVHSKYDNAAKRIFFTNKSYLPSQTPEGLKQLREEDLAQLRGNGKGVRKPFERIYDYDVYNDLGDPDSSEELARTVLGGSKRFPYPRRCRTGRPPTKKDPSSEERSSYIYVPRDEDFSETKRVTFIGKALESVIHTVVPLLESKFTHESDFPYFTEIDMLYNEGVPLPENESMPRFARFINRAANLLLFETPELIDRDKFSWLRDEEFSRQSLAGLNPLSIQLITELPLISKLDPYIYGPSESAITAEIIEKEIFRFTTVKEALEKKRLFMLDYHDLLLPYVHRVRELEQTTLYGSRTVFFLAEDETLIPIAIELTRPASPAKPYWRQVFTPSCDATDAWLWKLAKVHVCAHDTSFHQLVVHGLRTHCSTEPYIIAAHRQLSAMHPIYRLLHPYFRFTMEINALARKQLINAGGIIESTFSPGKYSMELSSVAYDQLWRFDMEALPADLIRRGMAVEDPTAEHGLRLTIKDYPFAADGLLVWSSIQQWVADYVNRYYPTARDVTADGELQAWWEEVRTKGHADKKDEKWWPSMASQPDLIHILTTIIWVASGHHAAVNFGQYAYAGYFPNRPTITRKNMPVEDAGTTPDLNKFRSKPETALLQCFPSQKQATTVMAILDVLSTHSPDEEYLGEQPEPAWAGDAVVNAAFERFKGRMWEIEGVIDGRNVDPKLKNRYGAGIVPYELLKPFSKSGVTGMGVPNSISI